MDHNNLPDPRRGQRREEAPRNDANAVAGASAQRVRLNVGDGRNLQVAQWPPDRNRQGVAIGQRVRNAIVDGSDSSGSSKGAPLSSLSSSEYSKAPHQQGFRLGSGGGNGFQGPSFQPGAKGSNGGMSAAASSANGDQAGAMAAVAAIMMQQPKAAATALAALQQQLVGMNGGSFNGNGFGGNMGQAGASMQQNLQLQVLQTALSQALQQNLRVASAPGSSNETNTGNMNQMLMQQLASLQNQGVLQGNTSGSGRPANQALGLNQVGSVGQGALPQAANQPGQTFLQQTVSNAASLSRMGFGNAPSNLCQTNAKQDNQFLPSQFARGSCQQGSFSAGAVAGPAVTGTTMAGTATKGTRGESRNATPDPKKKSVENTVRTVPELSAGGEKMQPYNEPEEQGKIRKEPCLARKMPMDHNTETAYFEISEETEHEEELLCSHASCRHSGIKFLWCGYCEAPAYKRGFSKRHTHTGEVMPRDIRRIEQEEEEERERLKKLEQKEMLRNQKQSRHRQDETTDSNIALSESPTETSKGEGPSENDSSNGETNETSGNGESPRSSEFSSDFDETLSKKKSSTHGVHRTTEKDPPRPRAATGDTRNPGKNHKEYYTVSFVDRRATGENVANGSAVGTDTAMSSLSSASEHFTDAKHRPDHTSSNKRKREEFNEEEEEGGTTSSVSSMDEEGLSHFNSATANECAARGSKSNTGLDFKGADSAVASSLMPLADAAAAALKKDEEEASSMTSSTRAVKLPRIGNERHPRGPESDKKADRSSSSEDSEKRRAYWKVARNAISAVARISESQSQARSQSSSSSTPFPVSSAAGSGSNTGGSGKTVGDRSGSNSGTSGSGQGFASGSGTSEGDEMDDPRREEWAKMFRLRPPSSDPEAMTEWLIKLLETSDPSYIQGTKVSEQSPEQKLSK